MLTKKPKSTLVLLLALFSIALGISTNLHAALEPKPDEHIAKMTVKNNTPYRVWIDFIPTYGINASAQLQTNGDQKSPASWFEKSNYTTYILGYNPGANAQLPRNPSNINYGTEIESLKAKIDGKEVIFYVKFSYTPGSEPNQGQTTATITAKTMS